MLGVAPQGGASEDGRSWNEVKAEVESLLRQKRYAEAAAAAESAVTIAERELGPHDPHVAGALNDLVAIYRRIASRANETYTNAAPELERALDIAERALGPWHPTVGMILTNLAKLYAAQGRFQESQKIRARAFSILGETNAITELIPALEVAAEIPPSSISKTIEALPTPRPLPEVEEARDDAMYRWKLSALEETVGPDHPTTAAAVRSLADFYRERSRYAEAEALYQRALDIDERHFGQSHEQVAEDLSRLADVYRRQERCQDAVTVYARLVTVLDSIRRPDDPQLVPILEHYAGCLESIGSSDDAKPIRDRLQALAR